jgi:hypothetical protein
VSYVVLVRNPSNGKVLIIREDDESDDAALYETEREAERAALDDIPICRAWPYSVVEAP